jgi:hypothetical protein
MLTRSAVAWTVPASCTAGHGLHGRIPWGAAEETGEAPSSENGRGGCRRGGQRRSALRCPCFPTHIPATAS